MINLYGQEIKKLEELLISRGQKKFRATQLFSWIYEKKVTDFDEMSDVSKTFREELKRDLISVVATLKEREQAVIKMRFGLENCVKTTLEDIGKMFGVTKECIRQTEMRALNKLKANMASSCYSV